MAKRRPAAKRRAQTDRGSQSPNNRASNDRAGNDRAGNDRTSTERAKRDGLNRRESTISDQATAGHDTASERPLNPPAKKLWLLVAAFSAWLFWIAFLVTASQIK